MPAKANLQAGTSVGEDRVYGEERGTDDFANQVARLIVVYDYINLPSFDTPKT